MKVLINLFISSLAVFITGYLLPGIKIDSFTTAVVVAVVLGVVNIFLKPILVLLTLPLTILTLGLFQFVINAFLILLVSYLVSGFTVANFWWALLFSLVISLVSSFLHQLTK
ncbi:phage holin family protein [Candidatus Microgenomates bacterium]|nr:phage holin family protein [Candidatus Microgenomates bacterium]